MPAERRIVKSRRSLTEQDDQAVGPGAALAAVSASDLLRDGKALGHGGMSVETRGEQALAMVEPTPRPAAIVAVTSEDDSDSAVIERAASVARTAGSTVILWDRDAASPLESPLPTEWSGDGEQEQFGDRLDPDDLAAAGREPLARQIRKLRAAGVDAWAWLPSRADAEDLVAYVADQRADLIVVSADDAGLADDLRALVEREEFAGGRRPRIETVPG